MGIRLDGIIFPVGNTSAMNVLTTITEGRFASQGCAFSVLIKIWQMLQLLKHHGHKHDTKTCPLCLLCSKRGLDIGAKTAGVVWTNHQPKHSSVNKTGYFGQAGLCVQLF